jgi:ERCC4-related helicase
VYPAGVPERSYQLSCIRTALLTNSLVCLPTGLGKTLIAAVVMHNFQRWFPEVSMVMRGADVFAFFFFFFVLYVHFKFYVCTP